MRSRLPRSSRRRPARWGAAVGAVLLTLSVASCSFGAADDNSGERVVTEFFDRLIEGDAAGAGVLLSDREDVSPAALDNDVYSEAVRPVEARITSVGGSDSEAVVDVEYRLAGESAPREIRLRTKTFDGEAKIVWTNSGLAFSRQGYPGGLVIEAGNPVDLEQDERLVLLPGIYDIEYTDEQRLITIDPSGGEAELFELEFPVVAPEGIVAPAGAEMSMGTMRFNPVFLTDVAVEVQARFDELIASCSGLFGDGCPSVMPDQVAKRDAPTALDAASVVWERAGPIALAKADGLRAVADYTVSFSWWSRIQQADVDVEASVGRGASGEIVVEFD